MRRVKSRGKLVLSVAQILVKVDAVRHLNHLFQIRLISLLKGKILHDPYQFLPALVHHRLGDLCVPCLCPLQNRLRVRIDLPETLCHCRNHAFSISLCRKLKRILQDLRVKRSCLLTYIDPDRICIKTHTAVIIIVNRIEPGDVIRDTGIIRIRERISVFIYLRHRRSAQAVIAVVLCVFRKCQRIVSVFPFCGFQFLFCKCLYDLCIAADLSVLVLAHFSCHASGNQVYVIKLRCVIRIDPGICTVKRFVIIALRHLESDSDRHLTAL